MNEGIRIGWEYFRLSVNFVYLMDVLDKRIFSLECKFCIFNGHFRCLTNERIGWEYFALNVNFIYLLDVLEI